MLLTGVLSPGEAVRPEIIGESFGVSAVPVREALRILEGEGQVLNRPHKGYVVTELDCQDLRELADLRELLETEAVRRSMPTVRESAIEKMRDAIALMESSTQDLATLGGENRNFHFALIDSNRMPKLSRMIHSIWDQLEPTYYRSKVFTDQNNQKCINLEHKRILDAVCSNDVELLLNELSAHREKAVVMLERELRNEPIAAAIIQSTD